MNLYKKHLLTRLCRPLDSEGNESGGESKPNSDAEGNKDEPTEAEKAAALAAASKKGPTDEEARLLRENMQRKQKLADLTKEMESAQSVLAQLQELGGLDAVKGLVDEKKTNETKALEAKGEWDRLKQRMAEEQEKKIKEYNDKLTATEANLQNATKTINELTIGASFNTSKVIAEDLLLTSSKTRILYGSHFDLVEGKVVGFDKPRGESNRTPYVDASGNAVGFDDALKRIIEADPEKDTMLRSKIKVGAGSDSKKGGTASNKKVELTSAEKIAQGLKALNIATNVSQ